MEILSAEIKHHLKHLCMTPVPLTNGQWLHVIDTFSEYEDGITYTTIIFSLVGNDRPYEVFASTLATPDTPGVPSFFVSDTARRADIEELQAINRR